MSKKVVPWLLVIAWLGVIFLLSHQPATASNQLSKKVTAAIAGIIRLAAPGFDADSLAVHRAVREWAHFFAFFVLGLMSAVATGKIGLRGLRGIGVAFGFCVLCAVLDEWHQRYVPGRGAELSDVLADAGGAAAALALFGIGAFIRRRFRHGSIRGKRK